MKKIFLASFCCLGLTLLLASGAAAQDNHVNHPAEARGLHGRAILPPWMIFSNCGAGCTSYDTASGYYVAGSAASDGPGQTLAVGFTPAKAFKFFYALTPNTNYTGVSGGKIAAYLLNGTATGGPTTEITQLSYKGTIPDYPTIRVVTYSTTKNIPLKAGSTYFVCETEPTSDVVMLWMLSNSDTTSPFWFQDSNSCTGSVTWLDATGDTAPAFEVHAH